ncbi:MAG: sensor histidine kinase [Ignavibacteriae bacterium]|nr:sensor histidine kinase [Ignavibacteriota bacterium]MCB9214561.1 sensor histidine kinase [Ignavibacteria bacterium]
MQGSDSTIITIFIVSALIVLVLVVMIVLFTLLYQRKVLQQQMSLQDLEVNFQRELLAATLESQEVEQSRIARDLHDSVGVMLSTLQLILKNYGSRGGADEKGKEVIAKSTEILGSTIETVRRISHDLHPPELELLGLQATLEQTTHTINQTRELEVYLEFSTEFGRLPIKYELLLFRIIQELLNNTLKHSGASEVDIILREERGTITLLYTDNGKGIPEHLFNVKESGVRGLGLKNIESRARSLGASFRWDTAKDSGMGLELKMNLPSIEA